MNLGLPNRAVARIRYIQPYTPYEKFLQTVSARGDAWIVSQGTYILWWQRRTASDLKITVVDQNCNVTTNLTKAIIEDYPDSFHVPSELTIPCPDTDFEGPVLLTIDENLERKELLKEALRREGIMNFKEGSNGDFFFSGEISPILEEMSCFMKQGKMEYFHQSILKIRQLVADRLARRGLPLLRVWYHPQVNDRIIKTVVSVRYDVDRAITNMPKIWDMEHKYQAESTAHIRPFSPFYSQRKIKEIIKHPVCPEIALHGEFVGHTARFGGLLEAAQVEKKTLEEITGEEVLGVTLHGGELIENNTLAAQNTVPKAGFLYNASMGRTLYYFPYRLQNEDGSFEVTYRMHANFGDIRIPYTKQYAEDFYNEAMNQVRLAAESNGILLMMLHPVYFGFLSYLIIPDNIIRLLAFLPTYLKRVVASK